MADKMDVMRNKKIRGFILKVLEWTYPQPTASKTVADALISESQIVNPDIAAHVEYLRCKGYIEVKLSQANALIDSGDLLKLTAKGIDLLEETIADPGIDI